MVDYSYLDVSTVDPGSLSTSFDENVFEGRNNSPKQIVSLDEDEF